VHARRDDRQRARRVALRERLRQVQQAVEVEPLGVVVRRRAARGAAAPRCRGGARDAPHVDDLRRVAPGGREPVQQRLVVVARAGAHGVAAVVEPGEPRAGAHERGRPGARPGGEPFGEAGVVGEHEPRAAVARRRRGGGAAPRRDVEPVGQVGRPRERPRGARPRAGGRRVHPVPLALERVAGEPHAAPRAVVEAREVDAGARLPRAPHRAEQEREVRAALGRVPHRRHGGRGRAVLPSEARQGAPRPDLHQHPRPVGEEAPEAVGEAHGAAQVPHPVLGVGRLGGREHVAGHVRHHRQRGRRQAQAPAGVAELVEDGREHGGVRGHRDRHALGVDAAPGQLALERLERRHRARRDAQRRRVRGRQRQLGAEQRAQLGLGEVDAQHAAGRQRLEQPPAGRDERHRVGRREHARQAGRHVLAHAVAEERRRFDAERHEQSRRGVLGGEQRRQCQPRRLERARRRAGVGRVVEHVGAHPRRHRGVERRQALVERAPVRRLARVQLAPHPRVLRAAAREGEDHRRRRAPGRGRRRPAGRLGGGPQRRHRGGAVGRHRGAAVREVLAAGLEHVGGVGQLHLGVPLEVVGEPRGRAGRRLGRARAHGEELRPGGGRRRGRGGASSSTTCALVPPAPNAVTPARRGPAASHGRRAALTKNGLASSASSGLGAAKLMVGGSSRCRSASTVLIRPAMPAASPRWPTLAFTEPSAQ
jgi:hypothetical protein